VNKLKEANLTIAPPSAEDYVTYLRAVTEKNDLWLQVHLPCIKSMSPAFSVKPISFPRSQKDLTKKLAKTLACHRAMYNIMGDDRKNRPSCSLDKGSGLNTTSSMC
ncbi:hypothetical protein BDR04DRAFT_1104640, partial [Suillus decipiens]